MGFEESEYLKPILSALREENRKSCVGPWRESIYNESELGKQIKKIRILKGKLPAGYCMSVSRVYASVFKDWELIALDDDDPQIKARKTRALGYVLAVLCELSHGKDVISIDDGEQKTLPDNLITAFAQVVCMYTEKLH